MKWRYYGLEWLGDEGSNYQYERRGGKILEVRTEFNFSRQLWKYLQNSYQNNSICAKNNQTNKQKNKTPNFRLSISCGWWGQAPSLRWRADSYCPPGT